MNSRALPLLGPQVEPVVKARGVREAAEEAQEEKAGQEDREGLTQRLDDECNATQRLEEEKPEERILPARRQEEDGEHEE